MAMLAHATTTEALVHITTSRATQFIDITERIQTLVRVHTRDGRTLERMGERESLDAESVLDKFRGLVKGIISPERAESINRAIAALESQDDVRAVGSLLAAEHPFPPLRKAGEG